MPHPTYNREAALRRLETFRASAPVIDEAEVRAILASIELTTKPYADSQSSVTVRQCKKDLRRRIIQRSDASTRTLSSAA